MNRFRFEAFRRQFPFINACVMTSTQGDQRDLEDLDSLRVKRADRALLQLTPSVYSWGGSVVDIYEWERIDFVLMDGSIITNAVQPSGRSGSNYAHTDERNWDGETVLEAIHRYGFVESLVYIVYTKGGYNIVEHTSERNFRAEIYKPSQKFTWQQVIDEAETEADAQVKAEAAF